MNPNNIDYQVSYLRIQNLITMRIFFLIPVISILANSNYVHLKFSSTFQTDTTIITHLLDGNTAEWPAEKFATDKATKMGYAIDNDSQTLFLAINIPDRSIQKMILQEGMNLYIDTKGKKKENKGIAFPVRMENISSTENMKLFGFSNAEPFIQNIKTEGTANIAIAWDSSSILHIEYNIPLKIVEEDLSALKNKKISIGWKIEENKMPSNNNVQPSNNTSQPVSTTTRLVGVPAGSRPPNPPVTPNRSGPTQNDPFAQSSTGKTQSIWSTHIIVF